MACDCYNRVKDLIREKTGDPKASFNGMVVIDKNGARRIPTIEISYRKKKKDGTFCKNLSKMHLTYGYCPFCGKKLEEDDKE